MINKPLNHWGERKPKKLDLRGIIQRIFVGRVERKSPKTAEQMQFEEDVRGQLLQLKKKGLSIPIFTL